MFEQKKEVEKVIWHDILALAILIIIVVTTCLAFLRGFIASAQIVSSDIYTLGKQSQTSTIEYITIKIPKSDIQNFKEILITPSFFNVISK